MSKTARSVLVEALRLSLTQRSQIVDALLTNLDLEEEGDIDRLWAEEIERRGAQLERGRVKPISWAKVKQKAKSRVQSIAGFL